jgi:hypothetical protein
MTPHRPRIAMVSSTTLDLKAHREHVRSACEEKLCLPRMSDHLPAAADGGLAESLALVDQADVYLGVFAFRYGHVPPGHTKSITHQEYERAVARGIPVLIFLMDLEHPVRPADIETGAGAERLRELKALLQVRHTVKYFRSPEELHSQVLLTLDDALRDLWAGAGGHPAPSAPAPVPVPPAAVPGGAVAPARVRPGDLFRVDTRAEAAAGRLALTVDVGFSRIWLRNAAGERLPLVCGCAVARSDIDFERGQSRADPTITVKPDGVQVVIEFGTGATPSVRLEAQLPRPFLEGRTRMVFEVDPDDQKTLPGPDVAPPRGARRRPRRWPRQTTVAPAGTGAPPPAGTVVLSPEWFRAAPPEGVGGAAAPVSPELGVLLNAWLEPLFRRSPPSSPFRF